MSEQEFEVLDELYFLSSFNELEQNCIFSSEELLAILASLYSKGYIRCYSQPDDEVEVNGVEIQANGKKYMYLASKAGLLAHNTSD